jgi:hypothetical protein
MDLKTLVLAVAPPVGLVGFWVFVRFVSERLPAERLIGWKLFSAGGFIAIAGFALAVYFSMVEAGAAIVMLGAVLGAAALGRFFLR